MLQFKILDNGNLSITADADGIERLKERADYWEVWNDLMEPTQCNGSYGLCQHKTMGALTDSPIIGTDFKESESGENYADNVWWLPDYQVRDELAELTEGKEVIFIKANNV